MKYTVKLTSQYKKDYKLAQKRGKNISELKEVVELLATGKTLPEEYHDHPLYGNWLHHRECHIENDWLLIYYVYEDILVLELSRTGNHSDLFSK